MEIINIEARRFGAMICFKDFIPGKENLYSQSQPTIWQTNEDIYLSPPKSAKYGMRRYLIARGKRSEMENKKEKADPDEIIKKTNDQMEQEKEKNFVNLLIEIIVSITLKEFYETGD